MGVRRKVIGEVEKWYMSIAFVATECEEWYNQPIPCYSSFLSSFLSFLKSLNGRTVDIADLSMEIRASGSTTAKWSSLWTKAKYNSPSMQGT